MASQVHNILSPLRGEQTGCQFKEDILECTFLKENSALLIQVSEGDILKWIFLNENSTISIHISLEFVWVWVIVGLFLFSMAVNNFA